MVNISTQRIHETLIRELLEKWARATRLGRQDEVLANHAPDVTIFDVLPPLKYESADAYRKSWDEWQPATEGPGLFEIHDLKVTAGDDLAFAHGLIHCGGTKPDGGTFQDWVRATFCLRQVEGKWLITHQHIGVPMYNSCITSAFPAYSRRILTRLCASDAPLTSSLKILKTPMSL